jgi:ATP-dependent DNA helicase RecG
MLSAKIYRTTGQKAAYIRQAGFEPIQQEQMVLNYIEKHGSIRRAEVMELCRITKDQAYKLLSRLKESGRIEQLGERKAAVYTRKS